MKKIFCFIAFFVSVCTCCACSDTIDIVESSKEYEIIFDFANIDSVVYYDDDDAMGIHYDDPDVFDYETLAFVTDRDNWYGEYVFIDIPDTLITEFLNDYHKYLISKNWKDKENLNINYTIVEENIKYKDGSRDIIFYIKVNDKRDEE